MRYASLTRILRLWQLLDGRRRMPRIQTLADRLGVSSRTIRRYLNALEAAGFVLPRQQAPNE